MKVFGYNINIKKNEVSAKAEKPPSEKNKTNSRVVKIAKSFKDNSRKDIDKWKQALLLIQDPEEPRYDLYYDLVEDLMTNGHLQSQIQMREMSILNTSFHSVDRKTKQTVEETTDFINQQWFYKIMKYYADHIILGTTTIEFWELLKKEIKLDIIPRRNLITTENKIIPDWEKPNQYIDYSDDYFKKWIIEIGKKGDLGIINNIIPNLIWLKNVFQSWAEFCEKFGMPLITATTNTTDVSTIDNVHAMLLAIGEASVGTFPQGTQITFHEASRTDAYNTYLQFIKANQDTISKQIVGSTMLSDQGTNRSQTEVHERTLDNKISLGDKRGFEFFVNDQLYPLLRLHGYKISEDERFEFKKASEELKLTELWEITNGLLQSGHDIKVDWLSSTFNIPIEGKKKIESTAAVTSLDTPQITASLNLEDEQQSKYPKSCCSEAPVALGKEIQQIIQSLTSDLIKRIYDKKEVNDIIGKLIVVEGLELLKGLRENFKTTSPYIGVDLLTLQMMEYNLFEFSASKTEARLASITELLVDQETNQVRSFSDFKELAEKEMKPFNSDYLLTEYNLSVATGQNSANYLRFVSEKDTVTNLVEYHTVGDDKVRSSHRVLDGIILDLNDSEAMDLLSPNGYGCRCEFLQYLGDKPAISGKEAKDLLINSDGRFKGSQFEVNRANLKQVFTKKQYYNSNKTTEEIVNKLSYKDFGAKHYSEIKKEVSELKLDKTITKANIKELFKEDGKLNKSIYMGFKDYLKRKMILKESVFKSKTKNLKLAQAFPLIKQTLNKPSEVWYSSEGKGTFTSKYISFYKDQILVVETVIDQKHALEITDWYLTKNDKKLRTGLKIK